MKTVQAVGAGSPKRGGRGVGFTTRCEKCQIYQQAELFATIDDIQFPAVQCKVLRLQCILRIVADH